jgi:hypothetical protein
MRYLAIVPMAILLVLATATQLYDIAESSSGKAVLFAQDMDDAMDCATAGVDLNQCSPGLYSHDFSIEHDSLVDISGRIVRIVDEPDPGDYILKINDDGTYTVVPA